MCTESNINSLGRANFTKKFINLSQQEDGKIIKNFQLNNRGSLRVNITAHF